MALGGVQQEGRDAQGEEHFIGIESGGHVAASGGAGVDQGQIGADLAGEGAINASGRHDVLPHRVRGGVQILHDEEVALCEHGEDAGRETLVDGPRGLDPGCFALGARHGRQPLRRHAKTRDRALDHHRPAALRDRLEDVRRHPAGQGREDRRLARPQQSAIAQGLQQAALIAQTRRCGGSRH